MELGIRLQYGNDRLGVICDANKLRFKMIRADGEFDSSLLCLNEGAGARLQVLLEATYPFDAETSAANEAKLEEWRQARQRYPDPRPPIPPPPPPR